MPFCGWIKETHVGRPQQTGAWAAGVWLFCFSLFFVFLKKEKLKGGQSCLAPTATHNPKQPKTNNSSRQLQLKGGRDVILLCLTPTGPRGPALQVGLGDSGSWLEAPVLEC